jgi:circadian clock protein KaiC
MKSTPSDGAAMARVATGIPGLDARLAGGFPLGRTVLVAGDIGTGKTTLGVQFLVAGAARGETGILITADEKPRHIVEDSRRLGWDLDGPDLAGRITLLDASPYFTASRGARKPDANQTAAALVAEVRRTGASLLVIDGLTSLVPGGPEARRSAGFLAVVISALEDERACTAILTAASPTPSEQFTTGAIELLVSPKEGRMRRSLRVRSFPGVPEAYGDLPFDIVDGRGVVVDAETGDR